MPRALRFVPALVPGNGALVEVTVRTIQSRLLLRPGPAVDEIILGVLGRAQRLYPVRCCSVVFLSNHWHALLQVDDALQLARFMQHVDGNLSSEIGRKDMHDWPGAMWSRRYQSRPTQKNLGTEQNRGLTDSPWPTDHNGRNSICLRLACSPGLRP